MGYKKITLILCLFAFLSVEKGAYAQSATFNYTGSLQTWTVPVCVSAITIQAYGAQGGNNGGLGAEVQGTFTVNPGDVLDILVGQTGVIGDFGQNGGGGGGTFVWNNATTTLMAAAGGGGGLSTNGGSPGGVGSGTATPTNGGGSGSGAGGSGGNGGVYGANTGHGADGLGGGGAGWLSNGGTNPGNYAEGEGQGGFYPLSGITPGAGGAAGNANGAPGGYGGGGGSSGGSGASGGGGGYNGGGGGNAWSGSQWGSGGGGGSFNGGSNQTNTSGVRSGNGTVTIIYAAVVVNPVDSVNVTCHGGANGIATCHPSGGATPYTYSWMPGGATTQAISNLSAGIYTVTVSIPCGGTNTATVTITQPAAVGVATAVNANVLCNGGNNGKITATASNGSSPYTYLWSPGGQTTAIINSLTAGTYTVKVTDNCGATVTASNTITQPGVLKDSAYNLTNVLCNGGANGSVGSLTTGGTTPYTYLWTPTGRTTDTIRNLSAGSYTVSVTDSHGCSTTSSAIVTQPTVLQDSVFVTANVLCNGQSNGSASSITMGGVMPYTYLWNPTGQTTASASALTAGTYTLSVHDSNGCTASGSVTITQPNVLTAVATAYSNVVCNGGSSGDASVMPMGGTMPYTYSWTPGGSTSDSATGLSAGTYTVNVWDSNDCNTSTTVTVTQPIALIVGAGTVINNLCNGDNIGMAVAYVSGGPAPYTYSWSPIGGNGDTASGLSIGTYVVNVTDINGCTGSASTTVTQPSALSIVLNSVPDDGSCSGSAWLQVTGGVAPYTYLWVSGGATSYIISNQCAGNYCCRVTDANGCYDNVCVDIASYLGVNSVNANSGGVKIYPNPTNGQFTIENVSVSESSVIEIYNVLGEEVTSAVLDVKQGGTTTVNIGNEPNGVYLYRVKSLSNGSLLGEGKIALEK